MHMSVVGTWNLYYSWGCTGTYSGGADTQTTLNDDGGLVGPYDAQGGWHESGDVITLQWTGATVVYSGVVAGDLMSGLITGGPNGSTGCWYATRADGKAVETPKLSALGAAE
jgi:hypothetical protein